MASHTNLKDKFEKAIKDATPPPKPKTVTMWTPVDNEDNTKFRQQTKKKKEVPRPEGAPPPKKSIDDLP